VQSFASDKILTKVAKKMHSGAGPGDADVNLMKNMLLRFGRPSVLFRAEMGAWVDYLSNGSPFIAAYSAFMNGLPGRPSNQLWRNIPPILVQGSDANHRLSGQYECENIELCSGIATGLDGAINAVSQSRGAED